MLDLGASINGMPRSIYALLNLGTLQNTGVIIQLADRSNAYPDGVIEDFLVPLLKTFRTKIVVHDDSLTMEFDGEICRFNIFDAMRYPSDVHFVCHLDVIDYIDEIFELGDEVTLKVDLCHDLRKEHH
ncbi:hypothetical protein GH714_019065 [Hevea brasiliensis]|uniref:Uncharacterized protein n=1 Tax=Hevea brasiliensis TaxID=3981 RepID=A0A6A6LCC5_HEVBR|nr:hypothetical protein GH714_019065 [Hevea brasiliensis]